MNFDSLGARLRTVRKALGKSQDDMAAACSVSREMWGKYERDVAMPGGEVLIKVALAGVNVNYILTGQGAALSAPATPPLAQDEEILLDNYRNSPADAKAAIKAASDAFARPTRGAKRGKAA